VRDRLPNTLWPAAAGSQCFSRVGCVVPQQCRVSIVACCSVTLLQWRVPHHGGRGAGLGAWWEHGMGVDRYGGIVCWWQPGEQYYLRVSVGFVGSGMPLRG
jgi:hypothetical protein